MTERKVFKYVSCLIFALFTTVGIALLFLTYQVFIDPAAPPWTFFLMIIIDGVWTYQIADIIDTYRAREYATRPLNLRSLYDGELTVRPKGFLHVIAAALSRKK